MPPRSPSAALVALLQKKFGKDSAQRLGGGREAAAQIKEVIPTGIEAVDYYALGIGGLPVGRMCEVFGEEGCLAADTRIAYQVHRADGTLVNSKGGTIAQLYNRFHGRKHHLALADATFTAPSVREGDERIFQNHVVDVIDQGVRECFKVFALGPESITVTADHEFYLGDGRYAQLRDLRPGDRVHFHRNAPWQTNAPASRTNSRNYVYVQHHPIAGEKVVAGRYRYKRLARARAVIEAELNGLSLDRYLALLDRGADIDSMVFLSREQHVHHIDGNVRNDARDNLQVLLGAVHNREHAKERDADLRFVTIADAIKEIVPVGPRQTFDVKMADPSRNVIANRFAVHNCGKTSFGYACLAGVQRLGGTGVVLDGEYSFDEERAKTFGVNVDELVVAQPKHMEQAFEMLKAVLISNDPAKGPMLVVWDSIAVTLPAKLYEGEAGDRGVGEMARLMSAELPKILPLLQAHRAHLVALNQVREKIGVMFGDNKTTPGGKALKFYASWRAQFLGGRADKDDSGQHLAKDVTLIAVKTRFTAPFRKVRLRLNYEHGWDNVWSTLEHAKTHGKIEGRGPKGAKGHALALERLGWKPGTAPIVEMPEGEDTDAGADEEDLEG